MNDDFDTPVRTPDLKEFAKAINKIIDGEDTLYGLLSVVNSLSYIETSAKNRIQQYELYPPTSARDTKNLERLLDTQKRIQEIIPKLNEVLSNKADRFGSTLSEETRDSLKEVASILGYDPLQNAISAIFSEIQTRHEIVDAVPKNSPLSVFEEFFDRLKATGSFKLRSEVPLTPFLLKNEVIPYIEALIEIQRIIDEINNEQYRPIFIKSISQGSINVELSGGKEAIELIRDNASKWRREHSKEMAQLELDAKQAEIEKQKAEIREMESKALRDKIETEKISAEVALMKAQAEKLRIENQRAELDLYRARFELALEMITKLAPNMSDSDRLMFASRLLKPLEVLTGSSLEMQQE